MGTNFYLRINGCGACSRFDQVHVGKRSAGWSFGFRAYQHRLLDEAHPEWGYSAQSPFGFPVLSRADWQRAVAENPGTLWDEYGTQVDEPLTDWIASHKAPDAAQIRKEEQLTSYPRWMDPRGWRDAEGFRFDDGEFS